MKTLIWKEWREQRLFFFLSVGIIALSRFVPKLLPERMLDYEVYSVFMSYIILPILFSLFLGSISFTNEFVRNTKSFLLTQPVTTARIFWTKYFSGLVLLFILLLLSHVILSAQFSDLIRTGSGPVELTRILSAVAILISSLIIIYSAACFSSFLLKNTLSAIICTPFLLLFGILLVLPLVIVLLLICPSSFIFQLSVFSAILVTFLLFSFLTWQKTLVKNVSPWKTVRTVAILILGFSLGLHTIANVAASHKLNRTIRQAKAEGLRLTPEEIIPPTVPDRDNAAPVYQQAFDLSDRFKNKYKTEWEYMPYESGIPVEKLTTEQKRNISRIMRDPEFVKFYALIDKAVNMPACRFDIEYDFSGFTPNDYLQSVLGKMRSMARLLAARTYILSEEKRYSEALKTAKTSLSIGDSLSNEPVLITHLVRIAVDTLAIKSFPSLLSVPEQPFSSNGYRETIKTLDRKNRKLTVAIEGEPVLFNGYHMESIYTSVKPALFKGFCSYMLRPMFKAESAFYMQVIMKLVNFFNQPYYSIKDSLIAWEKKIAPEAKLPPRYVLARMTIPALSNSIIQQANYQATLDSFKLALALKIYREKHGNYPDTLSPLAPEVIPELPLDPFTGKDYIYRRDGKGFIVYSVGPNEKDDGGIYDPKQLPKDDDIAFKVLN